MKNENGHDSDPKCNCESCCEFYNNFQDCTNCNRAGIDCLECDGIGYLLLDD